MDETSMNSRMRAMLRAVQAGRAELSGGREPDLYVDGLPCCDSMSAHALVHGGYIRSSVGVTLTERSPAVLTELGRSSL